MNSVCDHGGGCEFSCPTCSFERGRRSRDEEIEKLTANLAVTTLSLASDPAALDVIQRLLMKTLGESKGDPLRKWGDRAEWSARTAMQLAEEIDKLRGAK